MLRVNFIEGNFRKVTTPVRRKEGLLEQCVEEKGIDVQIRKGKLTKHVSN